MYAIEIIVFTRDVTRVRVVCRKVSSQMGTFEKKKINFGLSLGKTACDSSSRLNVYALTGNPWSELKAIGHGVFASIQTDIDRFACVRNWLAIRKRDSDERFILNFSFFSLFAFYPSLSLSLVLRRARKLETSIESPPCIEPGQFCRKFLRKHSTIVS